MSDVHADVICELVGRQTGGRPVDVIADGAETALDAALARCSKQTHITCTSFAQVSLYRFIHDLKATHFEKKGTA